MVAGGGVAGGLFFDAAAFFAGAAAFFAGAAAFFTVFFAFVAIQTSSLSWVVRGQILGVYQFRRKRSKYQSSFRLR